MKEKMKYFLETLQTKRSKKIILIFVIFVVLFYSSLYMYSSLYEQEKMAIDRYNLGQSKYVHSLLGEHKYFVTDINQFNQKFGVQIIPIKNCYYINTIGGPYEYIFAFKLESSFYKIFYLDDIYLYGKIPSGIYKFCSGLDGDGATGGCDVTDLYERFLDTISKPCKN